MTTFETFLARIEKLHEKSGIDLSSAEDLAFAVMNVVSLEEHFVMTALKTGRDEYFDTASEVRETRKKLLAELMPEHQGETWCASKHLLAATMRLIEVGMKYRSDGDALRAKEKFEQAYRLFAIFWALKLKLVGVKANTSPQASRVEDLLNQLANCCDE